MNTVCENLWDKKNKCTIPDKLQDYMSILELFDNDIDGYLYIYDLDAERIYFSNKIFKRFPLKIEADNGVKVEDWNEIVYPKDRKFLEYGRKQFLEKTNAGPSSIAYRIIDREGNKVWVNIKGTRRYTENNKTKLLIGSISELVMGRMVDGLTGLCCTEKFMEDLEKYRVVSNGYLLIFSADNFKSINITQGRAAGDDILKKTAAVLDEYTEYPSSIYRLDGDCFAVILPWANEDEIIRFYENVKGEMDSLCTFSVGAVSYFKDYNVDSGNIYQYAESAMDQAKREGKDTLVFFSKNIYQKDLEEIELLDEIKTAVEEDCKNFSLCYQPQINGSTFQMVGVEVLLRYNSPTKGPISPVDFIPILEESGLICPVGEWVLRTALSQCREWRKSIPNIRISVNMSQVQLKKPQIAENVLSILNDSELPGDALILEVTESIQLQNYIYINRIFYEWKRHGIKISIDDFGTGYSSLSYLKSIEIDEIKIDRCFVDHVQCNAYNYRLLKNMIELAHSAEIKVCCEGVETYEEFIALHELNTDLYQGYLFAKPLNKEEFEDTYINKNSEAYKYRESRIEYFHQIKPGEHKKLIEDLRKEEIGNITESMEEVVYISDIENYELYYLNAAGRRITGVHDYKGRKCYQVLQGRDAPCENCNNSKLCENHFSVSEVENKYLNKSYIIKDKLIRWQGKMVRLEMGIDITETEIVSKGIQKRLDFEQAIVGSCRMLASENSSEMIGYNVVRVIGEFCQGSRAYILKVDSLSHNCELSSEWCGDGVKSIKEYFPRMCENLEEQNSEQRIVAQIMRGNKIIGMVGVDDPHYREDGYGLIKTMAYFLGYSMIGEENQQKLNHLLESRYDDIRNHTDLGLWEIRIDPENGKCELYPDKVLCRLMGMKENLPPDESFNHWYSRINDKYYASINKALEKMVDTGKITHVEYPWHFPNGEELMVQCVGVRREDCDGKIALEGHHRIINDEMSKN